MSRVPMGSSAGTATDLDGEPLTARYPEGLVPQGVAAELIAAKWDLSRTELDEFGLRSQELAAAARSAGYFDAEIAPIKVPHADGGLREVAFDQGLRDTSPERLAALPAAFEHEHWTQRFPQIRWSVTAGTSSQITDGAAAVMVASRQRAEALGLPVRARVRAMSVEGDDPLYMLTAVIAVTQKLLARQGLRIDDIDLFEVNEAFAPVVLAWAKETGADLSRVNVHGGAIALGHPLGASGARLATTLLNAMEQRGAHYGLQVMCEAGGLANATLYELAA